MQTVCAIPADSHIRRDCESYDCVRALGKGLIGPSDRRPPWSPMAPHGIVPVLERPRIGCDRLHWARNGGDLLGGEGRLRAFEMSKQAFTPSWRRSGSQRLAACPQRDQTNP
jgi:hypothetical protein